MPLLLMCLDTVTCWLVCFLALAVSVVIFGLSASGSAHGVHYEAVSEQPYDGSPHSRYHRDGTVSEQLSLECATSTSRSFDRHRNYNNCEQVSSLDEGVLPAFIIAAPDKSGTTGIFFDLAHHPFVSSKVGCKEMRFWNHFEPNDPAWWDEHRAEYCGLFPTVPIGCDRLVTGEATPRYFTESRAALGIAKHLPNTKVLFFFRDPVERLISRLIGTHVHDRQRKVTCAALVGETKELAAASGGNLSRVLQTAFPQIKGHHLRPRSAQGRVFQSVAGVLGASFRP